MIEPKGRDVSKSFTTHGFKTVGNYQYLLLIDFAGLTIIKRVKSDNTEILFTKKESGSIADFWADPTVHDYTYIHLI